MNLTDLPPAPQPQEAERKLILAIQKDYHRWIEVGKESQVVNLLEQYMNMSHHLSLNAYREPNRVLFELLQNSEDAPFTPQEERKTLAIAAIDSRAFEALEVPATLLHHEAKDRITTDSAAGLLFIACNEDGFSPQDVRSICSTGDSNKNKNNLSEGPGGTRKRYVGEKGIGFKTVFGISDCPHILSRHFAFHYKTKSVDNPLNLVMPHWIENEEVVPWARKFAQDHLDILVDDSHGTIIILPIIADKLEMVFSAVEEFAKDQDGMLFLTNISKVTVKQFLESEEPSISSSVTVDDESQEYPEKPPFDEGEYPEDRQVRLRTLCSADGLNACTWLRVDVTFKATVEDDNRKGVTGVPLSLAFPLDLEKQEANIRSGRLYAFMPTSVRDSRLPCLLHADFVMGTSRESFDASGNKWNACIVKKFLAPAYVIAFRYLDTYLRLTFPDDVPSRMHLLAGSFPPKPEWTSPSLKGACELIAQQLMSFKIIPCAHSDVSRALGEVTIVPPQVFRVIDSGLEFNRLNNLLPSASKLKWLAHIALHDVLQETNTRQPTSSFQPPPTSVWSDSHWNSILRSSEWIRQSHHNAQWFRHLYVAILETAAFPAKVFSSSEALVPTRFPGGGQVVVVREARYPSTPHDAAFIESLLFKQAAKVVIIEKRLLELLSQVQVEIRGKTFPVIRQLESGGLLSPFSQKDYLKAFFGLSNFNPAFLRPDVAMKLTNTACRIALLDTREDLEFIRLIKESGPLINQLYSVHPNKRFVLSPFSEVLKDLFEWDHENSGVNTVPRRDIAQYVPHASHFDLTPFPWDLPDLPKLVTAVKLRDFIFGTLFTPSVPLIPESVKTQGELEKLLPWLPGGNSLQGNEYMERYTLFLGWLRDTRFQQQGVIARIVRDLRLVPRHNPKKLDVASSLWIIPQSTLHINHDALLSATPHVDSLLCSPAMEELLATVLGVNFFSKFTSSQQSLKLVQWLSENRDREDFRMAVIQALGDLVPRWKASDPTALASLEKMFTSTPLLRVRSEWRRLTRTKVILLPRSFASAQEEERMNHLSGHPIWRLFPADGIDMWGVADLGEPQHRFLTEGLGLPVTITEDHLFSILNTSRQVFTSTSNALNLPDEPSRTSFVWDIYKLVTSPFPKERLFLHKGNWFLPSELHWTPFATEFLGKWKAFANDSRLSLAIESVYSSSQTAIKNFFDSAQAHHPPRELEDLLRGSIPTLENADVVADLLQTFISHSTSPSSSRIDSESLFFSLLETIASGIPHDLNLRDLQQKMQGRAWVPLNGRWSAPAKVICIQPIPWDQVSMWGKGAQFAQTMYGNELNRRNILGCYEEERRNQLMSLFFGGIVENWDLPRVYLHLLRSIHSSTDEQLEAREEAQWCLLALLKRESPDLDPIREKIANELSGLLFHGKFRKWDSLKVFDTGMALSTVNDWHLGRCPGGLDIFKRALDRFSLSCNVEAKFQHYSPDSRYLDWWANLLVDQTLVQRILTFEVLISTLQEIKNENVAPLADDAVVAAWVVLIAATSHCLLTEDSKTFKHVVHTQQLFVHRGQWLSCSNESLKLLKHSYGSACFKFSSSKTELTLGAQLDTIYADLTKPINVKITEKLVVAQLLKTNGKGDPDLDKKTGKDEKDRVKAGIVAMYKALLKDREHRSTFPAVPNKIHIEANQRLGEISGPFVDAIQYSSQLLFYLSQSHKDDLPKALGSILGNNRTLFVSSDDNHLVSMTRVALPNPTFKLTKNPGQPPAEFDIAGLPDPTSTEPPTAVEICAILEQLGVPNLEKKFKFEKVSIDLKESVDQTDEVRSSTLQYILTESAGDLLDVVAKRKDGFFRTLMEHLRRSQFVRVQKIKRDLNFGTLQHCESLDFRWQGPAGSPLSMWLKNLSTSDFPAAGTSLLKPLNLTFRFETKNGSPQASDVFYFAPSGDTSKPFPSEIWILQAVNSLLVRLTQPIPWKPMKPYWDRYLDCTKHFANPQEAKEKVDDIINSFVLEPTDLQQEVAAPVVDFSFGLPNMGMKMDFAQSFAQSFAAHRGAPTLDFSFGKEPRVTRHPFNPSRIARPETSSGEGTDALINQFRNLTTADPGQPSGSFLFEKQRGNEPTKAPRNPPIILTAYSSESSRIIAENSNQEPSSPGRIPEGLFPDASSNDMNEAVGRLGEEVANHWLSTMLPQEDYSIRWLNEGGESFASHDFEVSDKRSERVIFVEVKASRNSGQVWWSRNEYLLAREKRGDYLLVHVSNLASTPEVSWRWDPANGGFDMERMLGTVIPE